MQPGATTSNGVCTDRSGSLRTSTPTRRVSPAGTGVPAPSWRPWWPDCRSHWSRRRRRLPPRRRLEVADHHRVHQLAHRQGGSEDGDSPSGFEARLDLQNAEGGIDGHKLVPLVLDDQTNPANIANVVQEADAKAFGIVSQSPLFFLAAKYPNQAGVPVTGSYDDGPEWGTQPYTNMFASDEGSVDPKYPVNTRDRELPQGARWHGAGLVRLRDLAVVEPRRHRNGGLLPARRRQGRGARHLGPLRQRGLHQPRSGGQAARHQCHGAGDGCQLELCAGRGAEAGRREAQGHALRGGLPAFRHQLAGLEHGAGELLPDAVPPVGVARTRAPSRCRPRWRSTRTSPRPSSPTSASTRRGRAPTS